MCLFFPTYKLKIVLIIFLPQIIKIHNNNFYFFFQILLGWAGDWESVNPGLIYAISMIFCGGITALVPYFTSYYSLCALSGAFGFFIAANYSLTSIILVELISLENFTNAYGLLLLVQGMANLIGPPLAGKSSTYPSSLSC